MKNTAFTLIEILIVVILLGILAAIVVPQFTDVSDDARASKAATDIATLNSQLEIWKASNAGAAGADYAAAAAALEAANLIQDAPTAPDGWTYTYGGARNSVFVAAEAVAAP